MSWLKFYDWKVVILFYNALTAASMLSISEKSGLTIIHLEHFLQWIEIKMLYSSEMKE